MKAIDTGKPVHPLLVPFIVVWVVLLAIFSILLGILSALFGLLMVLLTLPLHLLCRGLGLRGFTKHEDGIIEYCWYRNPFARR